MKRAAACLLAAVLLVTGCAREPQYALQGDYSIGFTNTDAIVHALRGGLRGHSQRMHIRYRSHADQMEDISGIVRELMDCAVQETERPDEGDYLRYQYGGYEMQYAYTREGEEYAYEITITPEYYTTQAQEADAQAALQEAMEAIALTSGDDAYTRICKVAGYIREHVQYDLVHRDHPHFHLRSTMYGALVYGRATCQGYAVAAYRMLREAGVDARILTGTAVAPDGSEEQHAWNLVRIGDAWYNLDLTWTSDADAWFLKSDADFPGHIRDAQFQTPEFQAAYPAAVTSYDTEKE